MDDVVCSGAPRRDSTWKEYVYEHLLNPLSTFLFWMGSSPTAKSCHWPLRHSLTWENCATLGISSYFHCRA